MIPFAYKIHLTEYIKKQLEQFFPDKQEVSEKILDNAVKNALQRLEYCFKHISLQGRFKSFNYLNTDQYAMFLYILSNELYKNFEDIVLAQKVMYLNKIMHSINCMYDNELPEIFLFVHAIGMTIGKAKMSNYIVLHQNVTIGANNDTYPTLKEGVILCAGASVIGKCTIGNNVVIGANTNIYKKDIPDNIIVYTDSQAGLITAAHKRNYFSKFFNSADRKR